MELLFAALHPVQLQRSIAMTPLRQRMLEDMSIRNLTDNTKLSYIQQVGLYAKYFHRSPDLLGPQEVREYQVYLTMTRKLSASSISTATSALRFLYRVTLKQHWSPDDIPMPKKPFKLPVVLSTHREEVMHVRILHPHGHGHLPCHPLADRPERKRLLMLLTDGKPNDLDVYEGRYGLEDTRQAVREAHAAGLIPFCVTIECIEMHFGVDIPSDIRFTRTDTGHAVLAQAHVQKVRADPRTMPLMQACLSGTATAAERQEFGQLWQARVEQLLLGHGFDDAVFELRAV
jgi:hypothetical protein